MLDDKEKCMEAVCCYALKRQCLKLQMEIGC